MRTRAVTLSDELVRAAYANRLGELRVPMRPQPVPQDAGFGRVWLWPSRGDIRSANRDTWTIGCPLGAVGDRLWSRECWAEVDGQVVYRANFDGDASRLRWRSALQQPCQRSRLLFEITALRCERVQHITATGAQLAGFTSVAEFRAWWDRPSSGSKPRAPRDGESWDENPWVFVASVRRVEAK